MYGMIIVEPKGGLDPVDQEFFFVQSEWYLGPQGEPASLTKAAAAAPAPDFVVFNGIANQYKDNPIQVETGKRIRVFILDAGPSIDSSFHVVGTIFDRVIKEGMELKVGNSGSWGSQAVDLSPAQGAIVEFTMAEDGLYPIVTPPSTSSAAVRSACSRRAPASPPADPTPPPSPAAATPGGRRRFRARRGSAAKGPPDVRLVAAPHRDPALRQRQTVPCARSAATSSGPYPSPARISAVCSPSKGGAVRIEAGVADSPNGSPTWRTVPRTGCSRSTVIARACACGDAKAAGMSLIGPHGTSAASRTVSHSVVRRAANRSARMGRSSARRVTRSPLLANRGSPASAGSPTASHRRGHWRSLPTATASSPSAVRNVS
jgi:hypothetical protein